MILKLGALTTGDMVMVLVAVVVWYGLALVSLASTLSQPRNKEIKILNIFIYKTFRPASVPTGGKPTVSSSFNVI